MDTFNSADETWATSDWVANVYREAGVENVKLVYPHGIEKMYKPKLKTRKGPINYFHQGGPANRKGAQEAFDAFREVFGDDPRKATLTIKAYQRNHVRWYDQYNRVRNPAELPNVKVITKEMETEELVDFTSKFHVNIYPSYGEGWGFIPMESMAQGTPTICTGAWAHYRDYLGDLAVDSTMIDSPWEHEHPGQVYKPNMDDLVSKIQLAYDDYENQSKQFFKRSFKLHSEYNWLGLTEKSFQHIVSEQGK